jgi:hypothetical protein
MKKQLLLEYLNQSPDRLSLHDGTLYFFTVNGTTITLTIGIGEYHYAINEIEKYMDNIKNQLLLTLRFDGVENLKTELDCNFHINDCEILRNEEKNKTFELELYDNGLVGEISFSYADFLWCNAEELNEIKFKNWRKNNGFIG